MRELIGRLGYQNWSYPSLSPYESCFNIDISWKTVTMKSSEAIVTLIAIVRYILFSKMLGEIKYTFLVHCQQ